MTCEELIYTRIRNKILSQVLGTISRVTSLVCLRISPHLALPSPPCLKVGTTLADFPFRLSSLPFATCSVPRYIRIAH